jgi:methyl-accepting chemotaxis protein
MSIKSQMNSYFEGKLFAKLGFQIVVGITLMLFGLFFYQAEQTVQSENVAKEVTAKLISQNILDKVDRNFYERFGDVQAFSVNKLVVNKLTGDSLHNAELQNFVNTMVQYYVLYDKMMICDINGNAVMLNTVDKANKPVNTNPLLGKNYKNEPWFTSCTANVGPEGGAWYSDLMVDDEVKQIYNSNGLGLAFAAPIKNDAGEVIGVWYNFASWKEVTQGIREASEIDLHNTYPEAKIIVTKNDGDVIDAADASLINNNIKLNTTIISNSDSEFKFDGETLAFKNMIVGDDVAQGAYIYKGCKWNAYTIIPKSSITFSTFLTVKLLPVIIVSILLIVLLGYVLYNTINNLVISKINIIKNVLDDFSNGNLPKVDDNLITNDEIGSIAGSVKTVSENLSNLVKVLTSKVGDADAETVVFNNQGQLGMSLVNMRENLKNVAQEDQKRNWTTEGMAKFGEILRNNSSGIEALSENILINLVKYVGANQGGLFVLNDENQKDRYLQLKACYAWDKKKHIDVKIQEGEGLVGQAWQEGNLIYITDVPTDYIHITSGLGFANPNCILIVPLTVNDVTFGVIELASFNKYEEYQIEFIKKLAESIASTISGAKINERTKVLLEQSQQNTEEMRAQEEEMRQNMEEMQATSEEAERKSINYEAAIQRLNDENAELLNQIKQLKG